MCGVADISSEIRLEWWNSVLENIVKDKPAEHPLALVPPPSSPGPVYSDKYHLDMALLHSWCFLSIADVFSL